MKWSDFPAWLKAGLLVSVIYSLAHIILFLTRFIPFPKFLNLLLDKLHETLYFPQIYLSGKIVIALQIYNSFRAFSTLSFLFELIFTIILGFIIGSLISYIIFRKS